MSNLTKHFFKFAKFNKSFVKIVKLNKTFVNLTILTKLSLNMIYVQRKIRIKYDFKEKIENNIKNLNKIFIYS